MAQRRMISRSISVSRKLAKVRPFTALVFTWLIPHCDDGGNMAGDPETVKALVVPARPETVNDVKEAIDEMVEIGLVALYKSDGEEYLHINQWENHQTLRLDRATWLYPANQPGNHLATKDGQLAAEGKVSKGKVSKDKIDMIKFEEFWNVYPKKVGKKTAMRSWAKINPDQKLHEKIIGSVAEHSKSAQWKKDDGIFIPHPATWLNNERWNDELSVKKTENTKFKTIKKTKI